MTKITEESFIKAAKKIGCKVAMVKAVKEIEGKDSGFLSNGEVKILFEPHVFWKELKAKGIKPIISDICYPTWGTKPYGKESEQHLRLQKAVNIDRDSALKSASWGMFQILGNNYKLCGCISIQDFINKMSNGEDSQLDLFVNYIVNSHLDDEMREEDFAGFARAYNGVYYYKNKYDLKLKSAFNSFK